MIAEALSFGAGAVVAGVGFWWMVERQPKPDPKALVQQLETMSHAESIVYQQHLARLNLLRAKRKGMRPGDNTNAPAIVFRSRLRRRPVKPRWPNENDQET